jgi:hypothetical protein
MMMRLKDLVFAMVCMVALGRAKESSSVQSSNIIEMSAHKNFAYTGPAFLGTPIQSNSTTFLFDTASNKTVMNRDHYDSALSTTYQNASENPTQLTIGNLTLNGSMVKDTVCLADAAWSCASSFEFFVSTSQMKFDGYLGLAPKSSFVSALYKQGKIREPIVSFNYNRDDLQRSLVMIGENSFSDTDNTNYKYDT